MVQNPNLASTKILDTISSKLAAEQAVEEPLRSRVYTGTDQSLQAPSKVGDIFVIVSSSTIFISNGITGTDWVQVSN